MGLFDSFASQAGNMIKNEARKTGSEFVREKADIPGSHHNKRGAFG